MQYRNLDPDKTVKTIEKLQSRILERFPSAGLGAVCGELFGIANESKEKSEWISKPNIAFRIIAYSIIVISMIILLYSISLMDLKLGDIHLAEAV